MGYPAPSAASSPTSKRDPGEMPFLYAAGIGLGAGTGIWIDGLFKVSDPGLALITPSLLAAGGALGVYLWDSNTTLHRGVPATTALGTAVGLGLGLGVNVVQWSAVSDEKEWSFRTRSTITWITTAGGAVGGYFFGEWLRPEPRAVSFIASGTAWGALSGMQIGGGLSAYSEKGRGIATDQGVGVTGVIGYVGGTVGAAAIAAWWSPSYTTQKYMWYGYGGGTLAGALVFPFYALSDTNAGRGFVFTGVAGLAGATLLGVLTADLKDDQDGSVTRKNGLQRRKDLFLPKLSLAPMSMQAQGFSAGIGAIGGW
jgi:hypothetical protein